MINWIFFISIRGTMIVRSRMFQIFVPSVKYFTFNTPFVELSIGTR